MNKQETAFQLFNNGMSFSNIGKELGIGKTTAHTYVNNQIMLEEIRKANAVPNGSELKKVIRPEQIPNNLERSKTMRSEQAKTEIPPKLLRANPTPKLAETSKMTMPPKVFTGDDLLKKEFDELEFTGKFLQLIGKPSKPFSGIIWGLPKGGKSNLSIRLADYLQEHFGSVLYVAAEEGESATMQQKIKDINGSKMTILESRNRDEIRAYILANNFEFVFFDSINNAGIDSDFLELIKGENPKKSFVGIVQATKGGNYKGEQSLTHNCDFIIKVADGVAYQEGRFNPDSEMKIFEEPLYQKNIKNTKEATQHCKVMDKNFFKNFDANKALMEIEQKNKQKALMKPNQVQKQNDGVDVLGGIVIAGIGLYAINALFKQD